MKTMKNFKQLIKSKRGYTLVELLVVIAIMTIVASFSFVVFSELDNISKNRVDQSRVIIYNRAFDDFRFTDYSTLTSMKSDESVIIIEGGNIKINQYLNLKDEDIEALSHSGRGRYPETAEQCIAAIRAYCGTNDILQDPEAGMTYGYFYNVSTGKCEILSITDANASNPNWINLNEAYRGYER